MKVRRIAIWVVGLLLMLVLLGATYLTLYLDRSQGLVEQAVSQALGREVRIEKGISLHWSIAPTIKLNGLWIGNPEWAVGDYFLRADHAYVRFDLAALMQFRLAVKRISLKEAEFALETSTSGQHNWDFGDPGSTDASLQIDRLVIERSRLRFRPAAGTERELAVVDLQLRGLGGGAPALSGEFEYEQVPIALSTTIETSRAFGLAADEKSARYVVFKEVNVTIGKYDFTGSLRVPLEQSERIEAVLQVDTADFSPMFLPIHQRAANPESVLRRKLSPGLLPGRDIALQLEVAHLRAGEVQVDGVKLNAALAERNIKLAIADQANNLDIRVELEPTGSAWALSLVNQSKLDLGLLIDGGRNGGQRSQGMVTVDVALSGRGQSLGSAIDSARGHIHLEVGPGRLSDQVSKYLPMGSVLTTLLRTIDEEIQTEPQSKLECAVLRFDVNEGIATSTNGLALRTDELNVLGAGSIKLIDSEIDLKFKTAQREGLGISVTGLADSVISLAGTLQEPEIEVDVGQLAMRGLAAWATSGLSLIGEALFNRLTAFSNPCETVLVASEE